MPRSSHRPDTPVPVPISTTARASRTEARKRSAAPAPGLIGETPTSSARVRAAARSASSATYSSANVQVAAVGDGNCLTMRTNLAFASVEGREPDTGCGNTGQGKFVGRIKEALRRHAYRGQDGPAP